MTRSSGWSSPEAHELAANAGVDDPADAMRVRARALLDEHGGRSIPVRLSALFPWAGVRKVRSEQMPLEGALKRLSDGRFDILVREDASPARQRFSVAHELGHVLFYRHAPRAEALQAHRGLQAPPEEERLCNVAAEELLMPVAATGDACKAEGAERVLHLTQSCEVSIEAAMIRLAPMWRRPGELQLWHYSGAWTRKLTLRLARSRSLRGFEVREWNWRPTPEPSSLPWTSATKLYSRTKHMWLFARTTAVSIGRRIPTVLVCHELVKEPGRQVTDLELVANIRTRRAEAARPLPECSTCGGTGWVRSDESTYDPANRRKPGARICPCRFDQARACARGVTEAPVAEGITCLSAAASEGT